MLSKAGIKALKRAYRRERHTVCPTPGVHAAAQTALLTALRQRGLITNDPAPVLTEDGIAAALKAASHD